MTVDKIRKQIENQFKTILNKGTQITIKDVEQAAYGHLAGTRIEEWVKQRLIEKNWKIFYPNEYLSELFTSIGKDRVRLTRMKTDSWWGSLLIAPQQIDSFLAGKPVERWQQEGADLVIFYGNNLLRDSEDVILLNVKSHNISRTSRPPNIISAQRLLEFLHAVIVGKDAREKLEKLELWFVGASYVVDSAVAIIKEIHVKDLFKLDTSRIPQINFDAAIQIQWHVKDMVEIDQNKVSFIRNLAKTFLNQWHKHAKGKEERYTKLADDIKRILSDRYST